MSDAPQTSSVMDDPEADEIDALQEALDSPDMKRDDAYILTRRRELENRLWETRSKRTRRLSRETWDTLENLVGHKLRR